jgi:hypothetical protein
MAGTNTGLDTEMSGKSGTGDRWRKHDGKLVNEGWDGEQYYGFEHKTRLLVATGRFLELLRREARVSAVVTALRKVAVS